MKTDERVKDRRRCWEDTWREEAGRGSVWGDPGRDSQDNTESVLWPRHHLGPALPGQNFNLCPPNRACPCLYHPWRGHFQRVPPSGPSLVGTGGRQPLASSWGPSELVGAPSGDSGTRAGTGGAGAASSRRFAWRCCEGAGRRPGRRWLLRLPLAAVHGLSWSASPTPGLCSGWGVGKCSPGCPRLI